MCSASPPGGTISRFTPAVWSAWPSRMSNSLPHPFAALAGKPPVQRDGRTSEGFALESREAALPAAQPPKSHLAFHAVLHQLELLIGLQSCNFSQCAKQERTTCKVGSCRMPAGAELFEPLTVECFASIQRGPPGAARPR